jgi:uncharacterized protein (DUF488 family)
LPNVLTIGFTHSNAQHFFERLRSSGSRLVIDVRLHNTSQLAGFAKASDLPYFLKTIAGIEYQHVSLLAPEDNMLKAYQKGQIQWQEYETRFRSLMASRRIEERLTPEYFSEACLLCSEATPHRCHRRLVCEYLNEKWGNALTIKHL